MSARRTKGWWVDETAPDLSKLSEVLTPRLGIDPKAFAEWLGFKLGEYKNAMQARAALAQPKQNLRPIARDARKLADLLADISPEAEAGIDMLAFDAGGTGSMFVSHIRNKLMVLALLASKIDHELMTKPGRKRATARDKLLAAVVDRLREHHGLNAATTRSVAEQILVLSRVATPAEESGIKKAVKKAIVRRGKK